MHVCGLQPLSVGLFVSPLSTAAGAESAQAPSVFKQAKDKVSVSNIPLSLFFI